MTPRRIAMKAAIVGPLLFLASFGAACSSGSSSSTSTTSAATLATGKVSCSKVTGTITFVPPLTNSGTSAETTKVAYTASGCTPSGSNVSTVASAQGSATITDSTNGCTGIATSKPVKLAVVWSPTTIRSTAVSYSGYKVAANASGDYGFTLPNPGGSATVTGSFSGSGGATSTASTYSDSTAAQIATACASSAGLASLTLTTGSFTIG